MIRTAIDLFCGAGGLSEGFRQAGYRVLAGNDLFEAAGETFAKTHADAKFFGKPIGDLTARELLAETGLTKGQLDVLVGGPPCQAYSVYNHQRGLHDERANLFREYLRIVEELMPKWVVMENVTGITSIGGGTVVNAIREEFEKLGYRIEHRILKAENFGVPQERRRIFFVGTRTKAPIIFPTESHDGIATPFTTIWEAIGDLPKVGNGEDPGLVEYVHEPTCWYQQYVRGNAVVVTNHAAPKLGQINLDRMKHIPIGGSWRDIPFELLPAGMKRAKRSDHTKRYGRMRPDGLSCTVLTKCDVHWGAYIHPYQDRAITVREAARLQSFPDWFQFEGSRTEQYVQVGNAVPPLLGNAIGQSILESETRTDVSGYTTVKGSVAA
jgi:DNA (cytosine-5)-methyltransferase 1